MTPKRRVLNILVIAKRKSKTWNMLLFCSKKSKKVALENSPGRQDLAEEIWKRSNHRPKKRFSVAPLKVKVNERMILTS